MITYIDSENRQDYTVLFKKASTKLGLLPIVEEVRNEENHVIEKHYSKRVYNTSTKTWDTVPCAAEEVDENTDTFKDVKAISSLNEYFQHIKDLAGLAIGQGRSGSDPYFLRLPLDEPFFEINANTRGITVPGELSQIAVRGDKLAEIVFFRIDRYYDAVDLNTRHIYIEWELPDGTKGISRDFLRDTQSEKDKIIFGWVIGEELTQQVGTIKFAVRFVEWFDDPGDDHTTDRDTAKDYAEDVTQLLYSFSSLPATVSVVDSLNYSLFEKDEALKIYNTAVTNENIGQIVLYLEDSDSDIAGETNPEKAKIPLYVRDLTNEFYIEASEPNADGECVINLDNNNVRELQVEAYSPDGGEISYVFGRIEHTATEGTGIAPTGAKGLVAKIKFVEATDMFKNGEFNEDKTFYAQDGTGAYMVVGENDIEEGETYYERVAYLDVNAPGHYYAIADNRVGGKKSNSAHSSMLYIPWADKPVINTQMHNGTGVVLNKKDEALVTDPAFNEAAMTNRGFTNVRVSSVDAEECVEAITLAPIASAEHKKGDFTYRWFKQTDNHWAQKNPDKLAKYTRPTGENAVSDVQWAAIEEGYLGESGDKWIEIPGATGATYTTNEPGLYAVKIENNFNNDYRATDLFEAGMIRVTDMPKIPDVDWTTFSDTLKRAEIPEGVNVSLTVNGEIIDYDEIKYRWHKVTIPTEDNPEYANDLEEATDEQITPSKGTLTFNAQGIATIPFVPNEFGSYFLEITNTLNGVTAYYSSAGNTGVRVVRIEQGA